MTKKVTYLISCFPRPVTNKTEQYFFTWSKLFNHLLAPPRVLQEYTPEAKVKFGDYYVRGCIANGEAFPERCDENLANCSLVILDIDHALDSETPLPTPAAIHASLKARKIAHAVHTSANPARCRVVMPCAAHVKSDVAGVTWAAYCFLQELGLTYAFATESRTLSQPWFLPQTSDLSRHVALGLKTGFKFSPAFATNILPKTEIPTPAAADPTIVEIGTAPTGAWVIEQIRQHGTLHQAAKRYAGWLVKTTDWTMGQIFDELTGLVEAAGVKKFIDRWPAEREKLERWFGEQDFTTTAPIIIAVDPATCELALGEEYAMDEEYLSTLGAEAWVYKNLIIARHITIIIAKPGGGKTSFMVNCAAPAMAAAGYKVFYVDVDSPPSDHKMMAAIAAKNKFFLVAPNTKKGKSITTYMETLQNYIEAGVDMTQYVFIFDTMKKFVDMMSKKDMKAFLSNMKRMTALGATIVLLGHANKHSDAAGLMIFEGTGDVMADCDNLLYFAARHDNEQKLSTVTTIVDQNLGAKVRGIFDSFSFQISKKTREVALLGDDAVPVEYPPAAPVTIEAQRRATVASDDVLLSKAVEFLKINEEKIISIDVLAAAAMAGTSIGINRVKNLIKTNTTVDGVEVGRGLFTYIVGEHNAKNYFLTEKSKDFVPQLAFDK